ncbi:MAG: tRNA lysidine(34) synthetase TilS [Spirochaetales bacterium]|nr:tRNA lysidine(34) synthetase TilS [Spirochaetales bacterium]
MNWKEKTEKALGECHVKKGFRILVAYSGGPDSTALLHVLKELSESWRLGLFAAYLDHGLRSRGEIEKEVAYIRKSLEVSHLELFIGRIPQGELAEIAANQSRSIEDVAREKRYLFLESVSRKIHADLIALGHTEDDHLETLIMRFFQGSDITGLNGIPLKRDSIVRPLYYWSRSDVIRFLAERDIRYMTDSTNMKTGYLRNKIRLNLIPVIQNIFPGFRTSLRRFSEKTAVLNDYFDGETASRLKWEKVSRGFRINGEEFLSAHEKIRLFSLYRVINRMGKVEKGIKKGRLPYHFLSVVLDEHAVRRKTVILRGYGIILLWKGNYLFCISDIVYPKRIGYLIIAEKRRRVVIPDSDIMIEFIRENTAMSGNTLAQEENVEYLDESRIDHPLIVRSRMPGDRMDMEKGKKSLKKLFNEWKVPEADRWMIPVLEDRKGIIGILGDCTGVRNRFIPGVKTEGKKAACSLGIKVTKLPGRGNESLPE